MTLRALGGGIRRRVLEAAYRRVVLLGNRGPIVSFTFDDFPRTAYTAGGRFLTSVGARGTYYAAMGLVATANDLGEQFRPDDLLALVSEGHELGSHTYSHLSARSVSVSRFMEDVRKGHRAISEAIGTITCNFAYPYGVVTMRAKAAVGGEMRSCRSTYRGLNGPLVDLNLLRANALYSASSALSRVQELISAAKQRRAWLIFYTHDIRDNPSRYGCTPALFEAAVSAVISSGLKILPVADVIQEISGPDS